MRRNKKNIIKVKKDFEFAAFNGETPLPVGAVIDDKSYKLSYLQEIMDAKTLPSEWQDLVRFVEENSLNSPDMPFREYGATAFFNREGVFKYGDAGRTSNLPDMIEYPNVWCGMELILDEIDAGHIPDHIIDIHTHPGPEHWPDYIKSATLLTSKADFDSTQHRVNFLSHYSGQKIPAWLAIRPVGETCGDVIIRSGIQPVPFDKQAKLAATEAILDRALTRLERSLPPASPALIGP